MQILITGATGMIGAECVQRLVDRGDTVIAVLHREARILLGGNEEIRSVPWSPYLRGSPGAFTIAGDITVANLGFDDSTCAALVKDLDAIVHIAAVTEFGRRPEVYDQINIDGTENLLQLSTPPSREPIPFLYVSTAYVCGERLGTISEADFDYGQSFANDYERSKFTAEQLVHQRRPDATILRPSIVVGRDGTGISRDYKHIFPVLKVMTSGHLRTIPGEYGAMLDLVPIDYVADGIVAALDNARRSPGITYHLVGDRALSFRDLSDVVAEYPAFEMPRFVPRANFDPADLSRSEFRYYDGIIRLYDSYFNRRITFDKSRMVGLMPGRSVSVGTDLLRQLLDHALDTGYLGSRRALVRRRRLSASVNDT
ncbi:SDR family oxidoreductase [Mycobacteroides abscessus]|uniref:SDR family oxidoreductase n=1 Tax=Mycobacteroides abscessus TaxID=36809 RepID=UPI0021041456|nr:SDR family oxidoreductase [Mycobacteroides abscessus]